MKVLQAAPVVYPYRSASMLTDFGGPMSQQARNPLVIGLVLALLALAGVGIVAFAIWPKETQMISKSTSPDGAWSIEIVGRPGFFNQSYHDIILYHGDGKGTRLEGQTIDQNVEIGKEGSFAINFVDNNTAKVVMGGGRERGVQRPEALK
jgi:hypothetical protein